MDVPYIAIGLVLVSGGELLVRGSVARARRLGVSPLLIGLTLVGFGTSTPELIASLQAALVGSPGIAVGNVVGGNIANILLILGLAAAISPLACQPAAFYRDGSALAGATVACAVLALGGTLGRHQARSSSSCWAPTLSSPTYGSGGRRMPPRPCTFIRRTSPSRRRRRSGFPSFSPAAASR